MRSSSRWIRPVSECAVAHTCSHAHDPHMAGRPRERRISAPHSARRGDLVAAGAGRISHLGTLCAGGAEAVEVRRPLMGATPRALPTVGGAAPVAPIAVAPIAPAPVAVSSAARMPVGRACVGAAHRGYIVMSRAAVARQWRLAGHPHHGDSGRRTRSVSCMCRCRASGVYRDVTRCGCTSVAARGPSAPWRQLPSGAERVMDVWRTRWSGRTRAGRVVDVWCTGGAEGGRMRSVSWRHGAWSGRVCAERVVDVWRTERSGRVDAERVVEAWQVGRVQGYRGRARKNSCCRTVVYGARRRLYRSRRSPACVRLEVWQPRSPLAVGEAKMRVVLSGYI